MPCETCGNPSCYCSVRWLSADAMQVLYWCADHAPKGAEYFDDKSPSAAIDAVMKAREK